MVPFVINGKFDIDLAIHAYKKLNSETRIKYFEQLSKNRDLINKHDLITLLKLFDYERLHQYQSTLHPVIMNFFLPINNKMLIDAIEKPMSLKNYLFLIAKLKNKYTEEDIQYLKQQELVAYNDSAIEINDALVFANKNKLLPPFKHYYIFIESFKLIDPNDIIYILKNYHLATSDIRRIFLQFLNNEQIIEYLVKNDLLKSIVDINKIQSFAQLNVCVRNQVPWLSISKDTMHDVENFNHDYINDRVLTYLKNDHLIAYIESFSSEEKIEEIKKVISANIKSCDLIMENYIDVLLAYTKMINANDFVKQSLLSSTSSIEIIIGLLSGNPDLYQQYMESIKILNMPFNIKDVLDNEKPFEINLTIE